MAAPFRASSRAVAWPIPLDAPVTSATVPSSGSVIAATLRGPIDRVELVLGQSKRRGRDVLLEVPDARRARYRQHHRGPMQEPRQRHLRGGGAVRLRRVRDGTARIRELPGIEREPRDEPDAVALAVLEHIV